MSLLLNINIQFYILAYLVGSIPFGYLFAYFFGGVNVLKTGSGSTGATNVLRSLKSVRPKSAKFIALATLLCDALKGAILILIARALDLSYETQWAIAILTVLGHCFSIFLKFSGGKGVSTTVGCTLMFIPLESILGLVVWFVVGKVFKVSSIASLTGVLSGIILSFIFHPEIPYIHTHAPLVILGLLILYTHIPNIQRLFAKQEKQVL